MNTRISSWMMMLPVLPLLAGCPSGGGGEGGFGNGGGISSRIAYVANSGSNNVYGYMIATNGALTTILGSPFSGVTAPSSVTVSADGAFVYVTNQGGANSVSAFTVNSTTAELTLVANSPFAAGSNPSAVTVSPNGNFLYVANGGSNNVSAYAITTGTGALTPVTNSPFAAGVSPVALTIEPTGEFLYVANGGGNVSAYEIAAGTGALAPLNALIGNPFPAGTTPSGIATPSRP
ncbi:MAG TPA: beta-propeller fold lactonase family protein [Nitrospira sp.]|nr:beta-propeller fold lactonase family protein [Nitrospira sp.]